MSDKEKKEDLIYGFRDNQTETLEEALAFIDENIDTGLMEQTRGLGLNMVCCLSDLRDCSPIQEEAILANCGTKIFLKNEK